MEVGENPRLVHMYGARYFIDGDLNNPELRALMLKALPWSSSGVWLSLKVKPPSVDKKFSLL